jgi:spore germination cell wall hydrolase CwlJ-like protein
MTAEILVIALTILGEARGEGFEGMAGVASVIQTRAIERKQTASQVCLSPKQFSFWNGGVSEAKKKKLLKPHHKQVTLCVLLNLYQSEGCPM